VLLGFAREETVSLAMATLILPLLLAVLAALAGAAAAAVLASPRLSVWLAVAACGIGTAGTLGYLIAQSPPAGMASGLLLPGSVLRFGLDGLSGWVLLLVLLAAMAASAGAMPPRQPGVQRGRRAASPAGRTTAMLLPVFILGMVLTLIAADTLTLVAGFELMSLASLALVLSGHDDAAGRAAGLLYGGMATFAAICCVAGLALLSNGAGLEFAAIRAHPAQGWPASIGFMLLLLGAGSKAGLAPLHVWLPPAHTAAPAPASALMSGAMTKVALYVLIRAAFDLAGPATPVWWGVALLVVGAASAVLGALRANLEDDFKAVLACSTIEHVGFIAIGLGFALVARAADLPAVASLALAAALLHMLAHGLFKPLLFIVAGAVQAAAGSRQLARLGGLIQQMPVTSAAALLGGASLAALPPSAGFASEWLLFQSAFAAPRGGGLALEMLACLVALAMAVAAALAAAAAVRLIGIAFLGRPRSPRGSSAQEAAAPVRWAMAGLAMALVLLGLLPGVAVGWLEPALRLLTGVGMAERAGPWLLTPQLQAPGYPPLLAALLLALAAALALWLLRRPATIGSRASPAWDCGFAAAPAWLPFGDPITQYGPDGFAQPIRRALATPLLSVTEVLDMPAPGDARPAQITVTSHDPAVRLLFVPLGRLRAWLSARADLLQVLAARRALSLLFAVLVALLVAVAAVEQW